MNVTRLEPEVRLVVRLVVRVVVRMGSRLYPHADSQGRSAMGRVM